MRPAQAARRSLKVLKAQGARSLVNLAWSRYGTLPLLPSRVLSQPVRAQIEATNACNLRCRMCSQSSESWQRGLQHKTLSLESFKRILEQLPYLQEVLLNGVGEPLLNPHLVEMVRHAARRGVRTGFFTNGTLLTPRLSRALLESDGLGSLNVSIDAGTPEVFERIRPGARFSAVRENLAAFMRLKSELRKDTPQVSVWMLLMRDRLSEVPVVVELARQLGVEHLVLNNLYEGDGAELQRPTDAELGLIEGYRAQAARQNVTLSYAAMPSGDVNRTATRTCVDPWLMVYVNATGWINPCCFSFVDKTTYFGNILEESLADIWNRRSFRDFRQELKTGMPDCCSKCPRHSLRVVEAPA